MLISRNDAEIHLQTVATDQQRSLTGVVVQIDGEVCTLEYADGSRWCAPASALVVP